MKERFVDAALIAGLVIVALVIAFTLFSPLPERDAAQPEADPAAATSPETPGDITPVAPDDGTTQLADGPEGGSSARTDERTDAGADAPDNSGEAQAPNAPLPAGSFDLGRIGFSFATGGAGACNVPLEPWRHVAVSRDILESYPCGSEVTLTFDEEVAGRDSVRLVVGDTVGASFSRTANVYVAPDEPAFEYGVKTGRLGP